jgi:uncharacterized membrane protein
MENLAKPEVKFGDWIGEGWRMFTSQWKAWVLSTLVFVLICFVPMLAVIIGFYVNIFMQISANPRSPQPVSPESIIIFYLLFGAIYFVMFFAATFFIAGMHRMALKQLRGGTLVLRDLFSGGDVYFRLLGSFLLGAILTLIGAMLCILPAYIVAGMIFFTSPLIVDRKLGVVEAMQTSYAFAKRNWLMFTLFAFVVQFIASAGTYACYVGILATLPLLFTITAVAYRDCFGVEGAQYFPSNASAVPGDYGQTYQQGYPQPPSAIYGQQSYEPPTPGNYNPPFGYPPPPAENTPPPVNDLFAPPVVEPPPPALDAPPQNLPQPEAQVEPKPSQAAETLAIESLLPPAKINCPSCDASLPATASFCPRCGNRIVK